MNLSNCIWIFLGGIPWDKILDSPLALPVACVFFLSVDASGSARTPGLYAGDCFLFLLRPVLPPPHPLSLCFYPCATDWASLQSKVPPMCASRPFHCRLSRPALYVPPSLTFRFRLNLTMCLFFNSDFCTSSSQLRSHRDDNFDQTSILLSDASISHMDFIPTQYFLLIQVLSQWIAAISPLMRNISYWFKCYANEQLLFLPWWTLIHFNFYKR
jgi:hypothetical protein